MSHYVICTVCKERFDRDKVQAVKSGARRYAHLTCMPKGELVPLAETNEDPDLVKLKNYISNLLKEQYVPARVNKQIKEYKEKYNYTYSGMLKALIWFYEVKGHSIDKANGGIGIIPFIYQDAYNYYYSLFMAKNALESSTLKPQLIEVKEITITSPRAKLRPVKLFNLDDAEDED